MFDPYTPESSWRQWLNRQAITGFIIGMIVGAGLMWLFVDKTAMTGDTPNEDTNQEQTDDNATSTADDSDTTGANAGDNTIVVSNQPAGATVILSMVSLSDSGWVAVHEELPEGELGSILGAHRFDAGKKFRETVSLLRNTVEGETYHVVLHEDDGDSTFEYETEEPVMTEDGDMISAEFIATSATGEEQTGQE